jgi:hypothetical protein
MPKQTDTKKPDQKSSKKRLPAKQAKPLKDTKVKHAPPVSSKDIIAKAEANVRVIRTLLPFPTYQPPLPRLSNPKNQILHQSRL